ncbi:MAG: hypothetical protein ACOC1K_00420 [Nanoarchaeota archaeon]
MKLYYFDWERMENYELQSEEIGFEKFQEIIPKIKDQRYGVNRLITAIEEHPRLTNQEKVDLERDVAGRNHYTHLRQSLYNILKMVREEKKGFLTSKKIATIKSLKESCLIYSKDIEIEIDNEYIETTKTITVNALTILGENVLDNLLSQGKELAKREKERLESIGF